MAVAMPPVETEDEANLINDSNRSRNVLPSIVRGSLVVEAACPENANEPIERTFVETLPLTKQLP